jgi:hypothetical protein
MQIIEQSVPSKTWDTFYQTLDIIRQDAKTSANKISKLLDFHEELCSLKRDYQIEFELIGSCAENSQYIIKFNDFHAQKVEVMLSSYDAHCKVSFNVREELYGIHVQINA